MNPTPDNTEPDGLSLALRLTISARPKDRTLTEMHLGDSAFH